MERTFLLKSIPEHLESFPACEILDIYIPEEEFHPVLRIRSRDGKEFEMTKKTPKNGNDSSEQEEHTIKLSEAEFAALSKIGGKKVRKKRYYYALGSGQKAEVDIFLDELEGLCAADFEFKTKEEKDNFTPPDFCLAEVTQDKWLAGGVLAGGNYPALEKYLNKYNYKKI